MQPKPSGFCVLLFWLVLAGVVSGASVFANDTDGESDRQPQVGASGRIGCLTNPNRVGRLRITKPGVYENYLVDSDWASGNRVKITADNVILRNCEIRNASGNGIGVFGRNVVIENCRIHHMLAGTYEDQKDAHGITGRWGNVTIRNCEIYYVSGDCIQFDPDRLSRGSVVVENCTLWTGPLPADAAGFKKGQRPGENAIDTKTPLGGPRSRLTVRNCLMYGWNQPSQIRLTAALNIKENVSARIVNCLFRDNEICFRLRGPTSRDGAEVTIVNCAIYNSQVGVRMENHLRDLNVYRLGFGPGVDRKYHLVGRGPFPGYENRGEYAAPPFSQLLYRGFPRPTSRSR
ncbi:MAG: right-handed parallel beta-helix repeat-containing protein [Planctomycetes bacterium]|nr:right-handed parallel beta-helix repeat-containing protein [Planctomycetota bacterium]